jgi:hypothetical protein
MNSYVRPLIAAALVCVPQFTVAAQTRNEWSVQGSALYAGLRGAPYDGIKAGAGFELQLRKRLNQFWSLGCGVQDTHHSMRQLNGNETLEGIFCEPRKLVDINSERFFPYFSGRAAALRQRLTSGTITSSARGFTVNFGTGMLMPVAGGKSRYPTLFEVGVSGGYTQFGDFITSENDVTIEKHSPQGGGWNFVARVGLAVGLPFGTPSR